MAQVQAGGSRVLTYFDREIVDSLEDFRDPSQGSGAGFSRSCWGRSSSFSSLRAVA